MIDIKKVRAALKSFTPEQILAGVMECKSFTPEQILAGVMERRQRQKDQIQKAINLNFPKHSDHGLAEDFEKDIQYFDALFVSMKVECGCGKILTVTREMME